MAPGDYQVSRFFLPALFGCFFATQLQANVLRDKASASAGIGAGLLKPFGYFGSEFSQGISVDINGRLPAARFVDWKILPATSLLLGASFQFMNMNLTSKTSSTMTNLALGVGPGIVYYFHPWFQPMAFFDAGVFYNRLSLASRNEAHNAVNPFFRLKAGFFAEINPSVVLEASLAMPFYYLGPDNLYGIEAAVAVNYQVVPTEIAESPADKIYMEGKQLYEYKSYEAADAKFAEALAIDAKHERSLKFRSRIKAQLMAQKARSLKMQGDIWAALPLMIQASSELPELADELRELRLMLAAYAAKLAKDGVVAYDGKRYADCEAAMEKVLLVNPDDETAKIYLPRARSRRKAMERLQ